MRKEFSAEVKLRCLLWSARHCCLCGKACSMDIEIAHIPGRESENDQDSAIPLCYNCHSEIGKYNLKHPMGVKYRKEELKKRRDQVYEQYTRHLVPAVIPKINQDTATQAGVRSLPNVGFTLTNSGGFPPAKAKVKVRIFLGKKELEVTSDKHGYYSKRVEWHLNPMTAIFGNFSIPEECKGSAEQLRIQVDLTIIDVYDREHELLPFCYTYVRESNSWYLEPTSFENLEQS